MRDVGQQALDTLFSGLKIDAEWSEIDDRSFSWIAARLCQTVRAGRGVDDDGIELFRLTAETPVVRDVSAQPAQVESA